MNIANGESLFDGSSSIQRILAAHSSSDRVEQMTCYGHFGTLRYFFSDVSGELLPPAHPHRLEQLEVWNAGTCASRNVLNGAKRLNDWNDWNGLIPVMNGAKRLNPSIELRAGVWNVWNRRKPK